MSFRDHIRILKPREESNTPPVEKIQSFFTEEVKLPPEVFDGFTHEINSKKSSSKITVITVKTGDRDNDRDEILRRLNITCSATVTAFAFAVIAILMSFSFA